MTGRLGIDFGNANTVISVASPESVQAIEISPFSRFQVWNDLQIPTIPSIIHYREDGTFLIGNEVLKAGLETHPYTFTSLKTTFDTLHAVEVGSRIVSAKQAAEDFLLAVLNKAKVQLSIESDEPVAFTVPVDTFEKYSTWLSDLAAKAGIERIKFIDEPAAAALCFGKSVKDNEDYLIFDFGAGSLDIAVVRFSVERKSSKYGHCKVLGKKSMQLGGNNIDTWLTDYFTKATLKENSFDKSLLWLLRKECREAKEKLSFHDSAHITITDPKSGKAFALQMSRDNLVNVLEQNDFFAKVNRTIEGAERTASYDYSYLPEKLAGLFMVGGTSIIPELQKQLRRNYGNQKVEVSQPLDSIAHGAALFAAGASLFDHIQHDYAIEVRNIKAQKNQMKIIVQRGEKYPSDKPVSSEIIKAVTYGQTKFQILIYEISKEEVEPGGEFIDLAQTVSQDDQVLRYVCLNKNHPTLLETKRPVMKDLPALQIDFRIDENKHLLINTYRIESNDRKVPHQSNISVVRLV